MWRLDFFFGENFFCARFLGQHFFALSEDSILNMNISMAAESWSSSVVSSWNILQLIYETFMERKRDGGDFHLAQFSLSAIFT